MLKSPLRYPGGKSRAIKFLKQYIPLFKEFREPFFGGGSVSFFYVQNVPHASFFASELYYELYCLWSELKTQQETLIEEIKRIKATQTNGRELYQEIMERREKELSPFQRAVDFFILNRITFSGVADSGGYSELSFQSRFTDSSIERLRQAIEIVKKIDILNQDYAVLLQKPGEDVFIFLDPPYYSVTKSKLYGKKGNLHTAFDHERFLRELTNCSHRWLMTYDDSEYIRDCYKDFYQLPWDLQYGMNNYKQGKAEIGKELLIANFELPICQETPDNKNQQLSLF
ncbi:DNA adenine methylase [Spirulina sp. CS-785/01]|uniref:DNA adenine methylase n=1 Tax=Spirulina sp. CS-785/01 TaxID=3021716 RepID=UPI00232B9C4E|nr:DNA adenine methylase [Spirulina sp. CS-785/01]MDB9315142.1 DNA adenine methylase [Spirulina sp. CS-785/01]